MLGLLDLLRLKQAIEGFAPRFYVDGPLPQRLAEAYQPPNYSAVVGPGAPHHDVHTVVRFRHALTQEGQTRSTVNWPFRA